MELDTVMYDRSYRLDHPSKSVDMRDNGTRLADRRFLPRSLGYSHYLNEYKTEFQQYDEVWKSLSARFRLIGPSTGKECAGPMCALCVNEADNVGSGTRQTFSDLVTHLKEYALPFLISCSEAEYVS